VDIHTDRNTLQTDRHIQRERETDRQTERYRKIARYTHRQTGRYVDIHTDGKQRDAMVTEN